MRLSPTARRFAYVAGLGQRPAAPMVTVVDESGVSHAVAPGHSPRWWQADAIVYGQQVDQAPLGASALPVWGAGTLPHPTGNTVAAAQGTVAIGRLDPRRLELFPTGRTIPGASDPALSDDGLWLAYIRPDEPREGVSRLFVERVDGSVEPRLLWEGSPLLPRFGSTTLAWELGRGLIAACADVNNPAVPATAFTLPSAWKLTKPVPIWVPTRRELLVLFVADDGANGHICLASWTSLTLGEPRGYAVGVSTGAGYDHDARPLGLDQLRAQWLDPAGVPDGLTVTLTAPRVILAPPVPIEPPPPPPPDDSFDLVPDGTLVQDAIATLIGTNPVRQAEIICLHKNTFPECEWRRVRDGELLHWADASRVPGDPGWWIEPAPVWALDTFRSGTAVSTEHAQIIDLRPGVTPNRWRQTNTLYGLKGGGVLVQFDPRFPGQYTDMAKQGTPAWAPAGYEKQWTLRDGRSKWQYIVTPLTAKGVIPWGDQSMDVVIQEVTSGPSAPGPRLPFVPCPRPLISVPPKPEPKPMPSFIPVDRGDLFNCLKWLRGEVYTEPARAERGEFGLVTHGLDDEGIAAWLCDRYITYRQTMGDLDARHRVFADIAAVVNASRPQPPPVTPPPTEPGTLVPLHIDGTTFRRPDGSIWKYRAVTAFTAFQDFLAGRDLDPYAAWTRSIGGNAWRIFYTWQVTNFNPLRLGAASLRNELEAFRRYLDAQGLYGHHTALCDQIGGSPVLLSSGDQDALLDAVVGTMQGHLVEAMNEAWKNGGTALAGRFPAGRFAGTFATRSSWQDGETPAVVGAVLDFTSEHTPRDAEWPRKAKNLLETSVQGIGTFPATKRPAVGGEPIGLFETDVPGSRTANADDVADYYAVAELFGAGACLHGDGSTLQRCNVPGPVAHRCAEWAQAAREAIPADAQLGSYTRGGLDDCPLEHSDDTALRTFGTIQGDRATVVVVRPQPGWQLRPRNGWRIDRTAGPNGHIVHLSRV